MFNSRSSSHGARIAIRVAMLEKIALSDQLEHRLIEFAATVIGIAGGINCRDYRGKQRTLPHYYGFDPDRA